jgi:hypothetical protein
VWKVAATTLRFAAVGCCGSRLPQSRAAPPAEKPGNNVTVRLTRRKLIASGAAASVALALPARVLPASKTLPVFKLDPCESPSDTDCIACQACHSHDANSLFPSSKAADGNRAHIGCNCAIHEGTLDRATYIALFGNPDHLHSYRADLRDPQVQAILKKNPPSF